MNYIDKYNYWCSNENLDAKDREELLSIKNDEKEIKERFLYDLEFGTGGLRGVIGVGTNRINKYIVHKINLMKCVLFDQMKNSKENFFMNSRHITINHVQKENIMDGMERKLHV